MKTSSSRSLQTLARALSLVVLLSTVGPAAVALGQVNSWTNPTSANWQDTRWSLGVLPGGEQSAMITNSGWKAVMIGSSTAQNHSETMTVRSVTVGAPADSHNTLLLNYAGLSTPLLVRSLVVESNATMRMLASALTINGPTGVGMSIGGNFIQSDLSVVTGSQVDVGYIGPGVYDLLDGQLSVGHLWVGSLFNQHGGTNSTGIVHLHGTYQLIGGDFISEIYFNGGLFRQVGGRLQRDLRIFQGGYLLEGGTHHGDVIVPASNGWTTGSGAMTQMGGTNFGSLTVGSYGHGGFLLSNGVCFSEAMTIGPRGVHRQAGGHHSITRSVVISESMINRSTFAWGSMVLSGGTLSCGSLFVGGHYTQSGGTNRTSQVVMSGTHAVIHIGGGTLVAESVDINPSWIGRVSVTGGTVVITNLGIRGNNLFGWHGFQFSGGEMIVSNLSLGPASRFVAGSGSLTQSGTLTMANASFHAGPGVQPLGLLQLNSSVETNSTIHLPAAPATLQFANSSGFTWSNEAGLIIRNWSGSPAGNGGQRVIFGNNAGGLTAQQLSRIRFQDPVGLAAGIYPARILSTGEVVPVLDVAPVIIGVTELQGAMRITFQGEVGRTYGIEVSSNLLHWTPWMTPLNSSGTMVVTDNAASGLPRRFYRAVLLP